MQREAFAECAPDAGHDRGRPLGNPASQREPKSRYTLQGHPTKNRGKLDHATPVNAGTKTGPRAGAPELSVDRVTAKYRKFAPASFSSACRTRYPKVPAPSRVAASMATHQPNGATGSQRWTQAEIALIYRLDPARHRAMQCGRRHQQSGDANLCKRESNGT